MMQQPVSQVEEWFRKFVMEHTFLHRYPHYAYILAQMVPFHDPTLPVMGVSYQNSQLYLHVNVEFFTRYPQYLRGVLLHEVHHVVLGHLSRASLRNANYPRLMEIAMEISANEFIEEPLPGDPLTVEQFADVGVIRGQSTKERYEKLCRAMKQGKTLAQADKRCVDTHHLWGVGGMNGEEETEQATNARGGTEQAVRQVIRRAIAQGEEHCQQHKQHKWKSPRVAGRDPGQILEEWEEVLQEPEFPIDWKTALHMFVARMRTPRHTYSRPNRRHPHRVGVIPGRVFASGSGEKPFLLVAVDTSASISHEELVEIARHLALLTSLVNIVVAECDVKIQRVYRFGGSLNSVQGRGGTDLRPVFEPAFLRQWRPDGVIYFTDGCGPYSPEPPAVPTLWVLTLQAGLQDFHCPWGKKVCFETTEGT